MPGGAAEFGPQSPNFALETADPTAHTTAVVRFLSVIRRNAFRNLQVHESEGVAMKAIVVLLLLIAVAGFVVYFAGGYAGLDPDQQCADAKAKLTPGMSLGQVLDIVGKVNKYQQIQMQKRKVMGQEVEEYHRTAETSFVRGTVEKKIADGDLPYGFVIPMNYSNRCAFDIVFDKDGKVESINDQRTVSDLFK